MIYLFKFLFERFPLKFQAVVLAIYFISGMSLIKKSKKRKKILVFSYNRWKVDLKKLVDLSPYNYIAINQRRLEIINSYVLKINKDYNINFLSLIIKVIYKIRKFDLCLTCNIAYNSEREWIGIIEKENIPFVAIHKEYTIVDDGQINDYANDLKNAKKKFLGTRVLVTNKQAKKIIVKSKIAEAEKVIICGLLRSDFLFENQIKSKKNSLVLFSFGHLTGPFKDIYDIRDHYFSKNSDKGFVKLFEEVHRIFMDFAISNPDLEFFIQPKNFEKGWINEIKGVCNRYLKIDINSIKNLKIIKKPAQELMKNSILNICLNSTVALESRIMERNTLLPVFEEAKKKHKKNLYFTDFFDLFFLAKSKTQFKKLIQKAIQKELVHAKNYKRLKLMSSYYLGNNDGKCYIRINKILNEIINKKET